MRQRCTCFLFVMQANPNDYELMDFDGKSLVYNETSTFDSSREKTLFEVHDWGGWCHDSVTARSFNRYNIILNNFCTIIESYINNCHKWLRI